MASPFFNRNYYRNNDKNPMYSPKHEYKEKSHLELWEERKKLTQTIGDNFFRRSQRYRENPDYSPKHVAANWVVSDSCDYVRPSAD